MERCWFKLWGTHSSLPNHPGCRQGWFGGTSCWGQFLWGTTAILNHGVSPAELRCWCHHFAPGTLVWRARCKASAHSTLWANETRQSTKEKKRLDFILLSRFHFYLLGIVNGLCQWHCHSGKGFRSFVPEMGGQRPSVFLTVPQFLCNCSLCQKPGEQ